MECEERVYLIDRLQLLLMLSLLDDRPVDGFSIGDVSQIHPDVWKQVALSLLLEGRLVNIGGRLAVAPEWETLLLSLKDARRILAIHTAQGKAKLVYFGNSVAVTEVRGKTEYCIRQIDCVSVQWLTDEAGLPLRMVESSDAERMRKNDKELSCSLKTLEENTDFSLETPVSAWKGQTVLDLYRHHHGLCNRWVWLENSICTFVLRQDRNGRAAMVDTWEQREVVLAECQQS